MMFEFLFKLSADGVLARHFRAPRRMAHLVAAATIMAVGLGLAWLVKRNTNGSARVSGTRSAVVWLLQTALAAVLLILLWHPALSVATLRPQQNIRGGRRRRFIEHVDRGRRWPITKSARG